MHLGWTQCQAKQWAECKANLARAEELDPKLAEKYPQLLDVRAAANRQVMIAKTNALFDEAMEKYTAKNFRGAADILEQSTALDPGSGQSELWLGYMFCNLRQGTPCKQHMKKAVEIDPDQGKDESFARMMSVANQLIARGQ